MVKDDLPGADPRCDPQSGEPHGQRVLVLTHRRQRLRVDPRRRVLGAIERFRRQRAQQVDLARERLADSLLTPADRAPQIADARRGELVVELRERGDLGHRHQVGAPEPPDVPLHTALLMRAFLARAREARFVEVVRAQRDEAIGLDAPAALQHLHDRRAEVVVSHHAERAAEELERRHVPLQERLLRLTHMRLHEAAAREARPHQEQEHPGQNAGDHHGRLAPVDLGLRARLRAQRHEHLIDQHPERLAPFAHIAAHLPLGHLDAMLVAQPLPDPLGGVPLLARRRPDRPQATSRSARATRPTSAPAAPPAACAHGGSGDSNAWRTVAAMHTVPARERVDRQPLKLTVSADLLEQLHS